MYYKDQLAITGQLNDVGAYIDQNIPNSYREGIEIEAAIRIRKDIDLEGNISFSKNQIIQHDEYLDMYDVSGNWIGQDTVHYNKTSIAFSPSVVSSIILNWYPVKNLTFSFINKYVSQQYLDNTSNSTRVIDAYNVNDFRIRYTFKIKPLKEIGLSFNIQNVFNKLYESNGWDYTSIQNGVVTNSNNYFPQAPRNYLGTITLKF
jgi:iron complex outermembrane receptor protein